MIRRAHLALLAAVCMACTAFAQIGIGDTRDSVLSLHGRPTSIAKRGNREIFLYPKGGRVEFVDGRSPTSNEERGQTVHFALDE